ncbi:unnamed protein product, partial [Allacma fusca]
SLIVLKNWKVSTINNIPGPSWAFPLVGHLLFLSSQPYKTFLDWSKIYGPIFCLQLGSLKTVVINDVQIIKEAFGLMETSGRPPIKAYTKACDNKGILFTSGQAVLEQRKFFMKYVRKFCYENRGNFQSIILNEGCLVPGDPKNFKEAWMNEMENAPLDSVFHPSNNYFPQTLGDV